jgi:hypothetical protein
VFTDWDSKKDLITKDLFHFFIKEPESPLFLEVLKKYPLEVIQNIKKYILINSKDWELQLRISGINNKTNMLNTKKMIEALKKL